MQQQTKSVLQFSLKYYSRKNKELKTSSQCNLFLLTNFIQLYFINSLIIANKKDSSQEEVIVLVNKSNGLPYCPLKIRATQNFHANFAKLNNQRRIAHSPKSVGGPSDMQNFYQPNHKFSHFNSYSNQKPQDFSSLTFRHNSSFQVDQSYHSATLSNRRDFSHHNSMGAEHFNTFIDPLHMDSEIEAYQRESDQMQREIDELMEGKKNLENIGPSEVSTNLRQVLKGLTGFNKKLKAIGDDDDVEYDPQNVDLNGMTDSILGAFGKAQKKTAKKAIGFYKSKEKDQSTTDNGTMVIGSDISI